MAVEASAESAKSEVIDVEAACPVGGEEALEFVPVVGKVEEQREVGSHGGGKARGLPKG